MATIELSAVAKRYGTREVLRQINLEVEEGEFVSIVGTSGSGKTTFLKIASGLIPADTGTITLRGQPVTGFAKGAAIVFQNYSLLPWLSALENVVLAVESAYPDWSKDRVRQQATKYLEMVGLGAALAKRPGQLSGGMRQRVAIARAFAVEPGVLFLDEPFGALDALTRATLQQELAKLCEAQQPRATVVMITNSVDEAVLLSDRVFALNGPPPVAREDRSPRRLSGSRLSEAIPIPLARPRVASELLRDPEVVRLRTHVTEMLLAGRASRAEVRRQDSEVRMQSSEVVV